MHPGLPRKRIARRARKPQVQAGSTGLPCAMVLRLIGALPGEPFRLPPSPQAKRSLRSGLAPDLGAPGPHHFAVRKTTSRQPAPRVHRNSAPRFVTTRNAPHAGAEWRDNTPNQNYDKQNYFCVRRLTGFWLICPPGNRLPISLSTPLSSPSSARGHDRRVFGDIMQAEDCGPESSWPGLVPAIHVGRHAWKRVAARVKPGHDGGERGA